MDIRELLGLPRRERREPSSERRGIHQSAIILKYEDDNSNYDTSFYSSSSHEENISDYYLPIFGFSVDSDGRETTSRRKALSTLSGTATTTCFYYLNDFPEFAFVVGLPGSQSEREASSSPSKTRPSLGR